MKSKTAIIIVTYEPNADQFKNYLLNNSKCDVEIFIIDNSESNGSIKFISQLGSDQIQVIQNYKNIGIAAAQNIGLRIILDNNYKYDCVIQLDQDSFIDQKTVNLLIDNYKSLNKLHKVAAVGPGQLNDEVKEVVNMKSSGMLIGVDAIKNIGFLDESLFIDLVDYDWCWRAKKMGYSLFLIPCKFTHHLGSIHHALGFYIISIPTPIRHYYQFRNSLRLIREFRTPLFWGLTRVPIIIIKLILYPILLPSGFLRLKFMVRGIIDSFLGVTGEYLKK